jgi:hypothetical protein
MEKTIRKEKLVMMTPVRTRNISQSVAYRVVGMMWVINAACVRFSIVDLPCVAISDLVI